MYRKLFVTILILSVPMLAISGVRSLFANIAGQGETGSITVQIIAYYCQVDSPLLCNLTKSASGSLIDSNGMILTTYQLVSDTQGYADDFEIRIKSDTTFVYRASRIEVWPEIDSTLLKIYYDVNAQRLVNQDATWIDPALKLPIAPSTNVLSQLYNTTWLSNTQRVWMETLQLAATNEVDTTGFEVTATIHTLDRIDKPLAFLVYIFDKTKRPSTESETDTVSYKPRDPIPTIYQPKYFADVQTLVVMSNSVESLENLQFRFLVWDVEEQRVLWRDNQWYEVVVDGTLPLVSTDPITPNFDSPSTEFSKNCSDNMKFINDDQGGFCMDIYEVTNAEYRQCVESGSERCERPNLSDKELSTKYGNDEFKEHPVVWVSWEQAARFCQIHSKQLPSAEQWDKAAETLILPIEQQNIKREDTAIKGSNENDVSALGVYDLAGNVREWTLDHYQAPGVPQPSSNIIIKGKSYQDNSDAPKSQDPSDIEPDIGFRCVALPK